MNIVESIVLKQANTISEYAANSVIEVANNLGISTQFDFSSIFCSESIGMDKADRLIEITKQALCTTYINAIGGDELYEKKHFEQQNVELYFLKSDQINYKQYKNEFVGNLSIIDILMFNSVEKIKAYLDQYKLV